MYYARSELPIMPFMRILPTTIDSRYRYYKLSGEVEDDTESETRFNPYQPETEPNNEFILPKTQL